MGGKDHSYDEKIPDFPRSMFEEKAKRRVHLGLLFSEYVKKKAAACKLLPCHLPALKTPVLRS